MSTDLSKSADAPPCQSMASGAVVRRMRATTFGLTFGDLSSQNNTFGWLVVVDRDVVHPSVQEGVA
jgi:hypothetical protein